MEYFWLVVIGLAVGLVSGRFLQGNNFGVTGDMIFGVIGALAFGVGLGLSGAAPEAASPGMATGSSMVMAGMGALLALILRRVLKSI